MKIQTTHFGEREIDAEKIITFPDGLIDFDDCTRYCLFPEDSETPVFYFLQSVDDPAVAFTVSFATQFGISFDDSILTDAESGRIGLDDFDEAVVMLMISENQEGPQRREFDPRMVPHITSPLVVNARTRKGLQKALKTIRCSASISAAPEGQPAEPAAFEVYKRFLAMMQAAVPDEDQ
jgi:flagellar assembly factor FliW